MNVLVIGGRLSSTRWSHAGVVREVCRGLAGRGHAVSLACMSADDASWFAPARVVAMTAHDHTGSDWAAGFPRWARGVIARSEADVVISTSRLAWGDVWMPLGPSAAAWMEEVAGALGPVGLGKWVYKHTGVLRARAVEMQRPWPRGISGKRPARVAVVGAEAAGCAKGVLAAHRLDTRVVALPFVSWSVLPDDLERERQRVAIRLAAGVTGGDTFALASCTGLVGESLAPVFEAAARVNDRLGRTGRQGRLIVGVLARDAFHAHDQAVRASAAEWVRVLGTTARVEAALSACDVAIVPPPAIPDGFLTGSTGRFAADALRMARPVIIADGAPGAELVSSLPGLGEPGAVVRNDGIEPASASWERALARAMEPQWRERALVAAAAAGGAEKLGPAGFIDALEAVMNAAMAERKRESGPRQGVKARSVGQERGAGRLDG